MMYITIMESRDKSKKVQIQSSEEQRPQSPGDMQEDLSFQALNPLAFQKSMAVGFGE